MKQMPEIQEYMTPMPHTIGNDIPLKTAMEMMREHRSATSLSRREAGSSAC